jgi:hypothetical protein
MILSIVIASYCGQGSIVEKSYEIVSVKAESTDQDNISRIDFVFDPISNILIKGDVSYLNTLLEVDQLKTLTKSELRIVRNTIYAQYGYRFLSEDLKNHFSNFHGIAVQKVM